MNTNQCQLALCATAYFIFSIAHAAPPSRLVYAQQCAAEMGQIPSFNCMEGAVIPITKNGQALSTAAPGEDCDNPVQLGLGGSQCVPYSRFLRINTGNANVETVVVCRKYQQNDNGPNDSKFTDIAVIQHNKGTGNTCFFQSHLYQSLDGTSVPSPQENSANASKYWHEPLPGGPDGITCTDCHDADPFIWSKYITQVANINNWNPLGKWNSNYQDLFGKTVKTFKPDNNNCTACHRIGSNTCARSNLGDGHVSVKEVENKLWMLPGFAGSSDEWRSSYGASVEEIYKCCENPALPNCKTVTQDGAAVVPGYRASYVVSILDFLISDLPEGQFRDADMIITSYPGSLRVGQTGTVSITVTNTGNILWVPGNYILQLGRLRRISLPSNIVRLPQQVNPGQTLPLSFTIVCAGQGSGGFSTQMSGGGDRFGASKGATVVCQP